MTSSLILRLMMMVMMMAMIPSPAPLTPFSSFLLNLFVFFSVYHCSSCSDFIWSHRQHHQHLNHLTIPKVCPFIDQTESPFTFVVLSTPDMVLKWLAPFIALMTAKKKIISHGWYLWNLRMLRISYWGGFGFFEMTVRDQWWWYDGHPWYSWLLSAENTTDELSVHLNW